MAKVSFDFKSLGEKSFKRILTNLERKYNLTVNDVQVDKKPRRRSGMPIKTATFMFDEATKLEMLISGPNGELYQMKVNGRVVPMRSTEERLVIGQIVDTVEAAIGRSKKNARKAKLTLPKKASSRKSVEDKLKEFEDQKTQLEGDLESLRDTLKGWKSKNADKERILAANHEEIAELERQFEKLTEKIEEMQEAA